MNKSNHDKIFNTDHLKKNLKLKSIRSGAVTLSSQGVTFVIRIGFIMIMARLLNPDDFGIIAMVATITGFAKVFKDLGLSMSTIQREKINHAQVSTIFWINVAIGVLLMIVVAVLSPLAAWFYKMPQLVWVMIVISTTFLFGGLSVQHQALLNRQMKFEKIAIVNVLSMTIGVLAAIYAAKHGFNYWALVVNSIVSSGVLAVGLWFASGWLPGLPVRGVGVRSMLEFGMNITGFNVINYFARNLDNILLGRFCGATTLGLYSKAYQLLMLPISNLRIPLNNVALPNLSRLQNDSENYRVYYNKYISILSFISMPIVVLMFVCSDNIIMVILGSEWIGASGLFKILALVAFIQPIASSRGLVLLSLGQGRRYLRWGVINAIATIMAFAVGIYWGAKGVAFAYVAENYIILLPSLWYVYKDTPIKISDFFLSISKPAIASIIMGLVSVFLVKYLANLKDIYILLSCCVFCFFVYLLCWALIPGGTKNLKEYYLYGFLLFNKG